MTENLDDRAWSNFVIRSDPFALQIDGPKRAAAIACCYMGGANSGGINSFLTATPELGSQALLEALDEIGAAKAAKQLDVILAVLGEPLLPASQEVRWQALERLWNGRPRSSRRAFG